MLKRETAHRVGFGEDFLCPGIGQSGGVAQSGQPRGGRPEGRDR